MRILVATRFSSPGAFYRFSKYGPIESTVYLVSRAEITGGSNDNSFNPTFGHRYDGLSAPLGEFYGASLYDAMPSAPTALRLPLPRSLGFRPAPRGSGDRRGRHDPPTSLLSIGIRLLCLYGPRSIQLLARAIRIVSRNGVGFGAGFAYTNYLTFRVTYAIFSPGKTYGAFQDNATRFAWKPWAVSSPSFSYHIDVMAVNPRLGPVSLASAHQPLYKDGLPTAMNPVGSPWHATKTTTHGRAVG